MGNLLKLLQRDEARRDDLYNVFVDFESKIIHSSRLANMLNVKKWCSQNAEKVMHIKGRLLDQAMILYNYVPFQNGNFSQRKEFAPRVSKFFPV